MSLSRDYFYLLSSDSESDRISAATSLIDDLVKLDDNKEWDYTINRLITGLTSSRSNSRIGFSMCLVEILTIRIDSKAYSLDQYFEDLLSKTAVASNLSGKETRSLLFGRLFGLQVLLNLPFVYDPDHYLKFLSHLFDLGLIKNWLKEPTFFTIIESIGKYIGNSNHKKSNDAKVYGFIIDLIKEKSLLEGFEGIGLFLSIPKKFTSDVLTNPLLKSNHANLIKVLKSYESANLHFVWELIIDELIAEEIANDKLEAKGTEGKHKHKQKKAKVDKVISIRDFYKSVLDEQFFSATSSTESKNQGFKIFERSLIKLPPSKVSFLFNDNILRSFINQMSNSKNYLNSLASKIAGSFTDVVKQDSRKLLPILSSLLVKCYNFDNLSKSKTINGLLAATSQANIDEIIAFFIDVLNKYQDYDMNQLSLYLDKLLLIFQKNKNHISIATIKSVLAVLVKLAFFEENSKLSELSINKLNSILSEIIILSANEDEKNSKTVSWPYHIILEIGSQEETSKCNVELDDELLKVKSKSLKFLKKLHNLKQNSTSKSLDAFEILLAFNLFQLYLQNPESFDNLQEILKILQNFLNNEINFVIDNDNDLKNLIEILLSFLVNDGKLFKKIIFIVWEDIVNYLNWDCLKLLIDVLECRENKEGEMALFDREDDQDLEVDEEHDHEHEDEEEEEEEDEEEEEEDEEEEEEDEEEEEEDEDIEEIAAENDENEIDRTTQLKLAEALGIPTENGEILSDSEESEDMDDDQMMLIDDQLSRIFKERHESMNSIMTGNKRKLEKIEARSNIIFFKNRVLDLLEIYIQKNTQHQDLNLQLIMPLNSLIKLTTDENIGNKSAKILKERLFKLKISIDNDEKASQLFEILKELVKLGETSSMKKSQNAVNISCIFIVKILINYKFEYVDSLIDIYTECLKRWINSKQSKLQPNFFFDFINWLNSKKNEKNKS